MATLQRLNQLRDRITQLRSQNRGDLFRAAAQLVNPYELMSKEAGAKVISRAYFKLWEILYRFQLLEGLSGGKSVHLCEAPGAFVQATLDFVGQDRAWSTMSVTLPGDLQWKSEEPVCYADILDPNTAWAQAEGFQGADLVTGDGGFEIQASHRNDQETLNFPLFHAQVKLGLSMLRPGGSLVVKLFDMFEDQTRQLITAVSHHFEEIHIVKPLGSRVCNSERYLVGKCKLPQPRETPISMNLEEVSNKMAEQQITALGHALNIVQQHWMAKPWHLLQSHALDMHCRARAQAGLRQIGWE